MINEELLEIFNEKLDISKMPNDIVAHFLYAISKYLHHSTNDTIGGRTTNFLKDKIDKIVNLYTLIGIQKIEIVKAITNFPQLLNIADVLYAKYLLLGVIENKDNTVHKQNFINNSKDLMISLSMMYSRYKLICYSGYNKFTWNSLVHSTENEFARIFTKGIYKKPYQVFANIDQAKIWLENSEFDFDLEEFKNLDVNKEFVEKYEKREFRRI